MNRKNSKKEKKVEKAIGSIKQIKHIRKKGKINIYILSSSSTEHTHKSLSQSKEKRV